MLPPGSSIDENPFLKPEDHAASSSAESGLRERLNEITIPSTETPRPAPANPQPSPQTTDPPHEHEGSNVNGNSCNDGDDDEEEEEEEISTPAFSRTECGAEDEIVVSSAIGDGNTRFV